MTYMEDDLFETMERNDFFAFLMDSIRESYPEIYEVYDNYLDDEPYDTTLEAIRALEVRRTET